MWRALFSIVLLAGSALADPPRVAPRQLAELTAIVADLVPEVRYPRLIARRYGARLAPYGGWSRELVDFTLAGVAREGGVAPYRRWLHRQQQIRLLDVHKILSDLDFLLIPDEGSTVALSHERLAELEMAKKAIGKEFPGDFFYKSLDLQIPQTFFVDQWRPSSEHLEPISNMVIGEKGLILLPEFEVTDGGRRRNLSEWGMEQFARGVAEFRVTSEALAQGTFATFKQLMRWVRYLGEYPRLKPSQLTERAMQSLRKELESPGQLIETLKLIREADVETGTGIKLNDLIEKLQLYSKDSILTTELLRRYGIAGLYEQAGRRPFERRVYEPLIPRTPEQSRLAGQVGKSSLRKTLGDYTGGKDLVVYHRTALSAAQNIAEGALWKSNNRAVIRGKVTSSAMADSALYVATETEALGYGDAYVRMVLDHRAVEGVDSVRDQGNGNGAGLYALLTRDAIARDAQGVLRIDKPSAEGIVRDLVEVLTAPATSKDQKESVVRALAAILRPETNADDAKLFWDVQARVSESELVEVFVDSYFARAGIAEKLLRHHAEPGFFARAYELLVRRSYQSESDVVKEAVLRLLAQGSDAFDGAPEMKRLLPAIEGALFLSAASDSAVFTDAEISGFYQRTQLERWLRHLESRMKLGAVESWWVLSYQARMIPKMATDLRARLYVEFKRLSQTQDRLRLATGLSSFIEDLFSDASFVLQVLESSSDELAPFRADLQDLARAGTRTRECSSAILEALARMPVSILERLPWARDLLRAQLVGLAAAHRMDRQALDLMLSVVAWRKQVDRELRSMVADASLPYSQRIQLSDLISVEAVRRTYEQLLDPVEIVSALSRERDYYQREARRLLEITASDPARAALVLAPIRKWIYIYRTVFEDGVEVYPKDLPQSDLIALARRIADGQVVFTRMDLQAQIGFAVDWFGNHANRHHLPDGEVDRLARRLPQALLGLGSPTTVLYELARFESQHGWPLNQDLFPELLQQMTVAEIDADTPEARRIRSEFFIQADAVARMRADVEDLGSPRSLERARAVESLLQAPRLLTAVQRDRVARAWGELASAPRGTRSVEFQAVLDRIEAWLSEGVSRIRVGSYAKLRARMAVEEISQTRTARRGSEVLVELRDTILRVSSFEPSIGKRLREIGAQGSAESRQLVASLIEHEPRLMILADEPVALPVVSLPVVKSSVTLDLPCLLRELKLVPSSTR